MASPARKPATYEDLLKLPDDKIGEIVDGELYASPRPAVPHVRGAFGPQQRAGRPFQFGRGGPGGWWIPGRAGAASRRRHAGARSGGLAARAASAGCPMRPR